MNPPSHPAFEADLKAFLDGELSLWRRVQLRRHLQNCPQCREEIRLMQTIETELKSAANAPLPADLRAKILEGAPLQTPMPKAPLRLRPQFVFAAGSTLVLAAMVMFPVFNRARENARRSGAVSNISQIGLGHRQYIQDYDQTSPMSASAASAGDATAQRVAPGAAQNFSRGVKINGDWRSSGNSSGAENAMNFDGIVPAQRQVHKQGSISVSVDDAEAKGSAVEILIKNAGGFVAQNALSTGEGGRKTATLDVRVPVAQFENIVAKIGKLGTVREKSVNGEDITARITNAGARRRSLSRELSIREAQLRAAKAKNKAAIVSDVRSLRFQANQARAQLEYARKYAALATLFVTLQDKPKPAPIAGPKSELGQTARLAWSSFLLSAQLPLQLLIWILAYAPLWVPALLLWRKFGRKLIGAS